jgi:hypothetical protein
LANPCIVKRAKISVTFRSVMWQKSCAKDLMIFEAHHFVGFVLHGHERIRGRDWDRKHKFFGSRIRVRTQGATGLRARCYAIINPDREASFHVNPFAIAYIALTSPFDFGKFVFTYDAWNSASSTPAS